MQHSNNSEQLFTFKTLFGLIGLEPVGRSGKETERRGNFLMDIWTTLKVSTSSGVINCMSKKKGHLSATPLPQQYNERTGNTCVLTRMPRRQRHTNPLPRIHITESNTVLIKRRCHLQMSGSSS